MYTYRRFRTSKSAVTIILIALALVAWGILGFKGNTLAKQPGAGQQATAKVTISGAMETEGEQTFSIARDNNKKLELHGGTVSSLPVHIKYSFVDTQAGCDCGEDPILCDLKKHLVDYDHTVRWHVLIRVDIASLMKDPDHISTTNSNGHFIDITTEVIDANGDTKYVRFWMPQGPRGPKSGPVTVELLEDTVTEANIRMRRFRFTADTLQVGKHKEGVLKCANGDGSIEVTVKTTQ